MFPPRYRGRIRGGEREQACALQLERRAVAGAKGVERSDRERRATTRPGDPPRPGVHPVDQDRAHRRTVPGRQRDASTGRDDARPVGVPDQHVVVFGQEPRRGRDVGIGSWRIGKVEQFAPFLIADGDQIRSQRFDRRAETGHAGPRLDVGDRRRSEGREVPDDPAGCVGPLIDPSAQPALHGRPGDRTAPTPDTAWRDLDERQVSGDGVCHRLLVTVRPACGEAPAEGCPTERRVVHDPATEGDQGVRLDSLEPLCEGTRGEAACQRGLCPRSQREGIACRDEVDRRAHQRGPDGRAILDRRRKMPRVETLESRPECDIRRQWRLRLHPDEVFDGRECRHVVAGQQQLAGEQGPVERPRTEHQAASGPAESRPSGNTTPSSRRDSRACTDRRTCCRSRNSAGSATCKSGCARARDRRSAC